MKIEKYHAIGAGPMSNRKIVQRGKIDTPSTLVHDRSHPYIRAQSISALRWSSI